MRFCYVLGSIGNNCTHDLYKVVSKIVTLSVSMYCNGTTCEAGRSLKRSTLGCLSFRGSSTPTALGRSSPGRNHLSGPVLSLREKLVSDLSCQITNMSSTSPVCVRCQAITASQFLLNFGVCLLRWRFEATRHPLAPDCVEFGCLTFVYSSFTTSIPERRA